MNQRKTRRFGLSDGQRLLRQRNRGRWMLIVASLGPQVAGDTARALMEACCGGVAPLGRTAPRTNRMDRLHSTWAPGRRAQRHPCPRGARPDASSARHCCGALKSPLNFSR